jgi:hypothetical protein
MPTQNNLNNPSVKVVVKRYFDMFLRFVMLFVFFIGKRGTYTKDTHVWVYTSAFAKRFGMPQEWVDDELKGAEALTAFGSAIKISRFIIRILWP